MNPVARVPKPALFGALAVSLALATLGGAAAGQPGHASDRGPGPVLEKKVAGYYEMPFPCGEAWTGTTRRGHSPSNKAVDWNRPNDLGNPVVASAPGQVTTASTSKRGGYGRYVQLTHAGGEATIYAHLKSVSVTVGSTVDQGTVIGTVGATGNATGPHLHFEERRGTTLSKAIFGGAPFAYGTTMTSRNCVDVPLSGNFTGDRAAELVIFRRGKTAAFHVQRPGQPPLVYAFGGSSDDPVLGDWNGDGVDDLGIRRSSDGNFYVSTPGGLVSIPYGDVKDKPIAGDWDGDGRDGIGVFRPSTATFYLRADDNSSTTVVLGDSNDVPVVGDWNGDGRSDLAVFDPGTATFTLRVVDARGLAWTAPVQFGIVGDLPVVGDWDGNGTTDLGVWRPASATFFARMADSARALPDAVRGTRFGKPRKWRP